MNLLKKLNGGRELTDVFIQCRLNSTRFPKKALKKICNKTIIELVIERCEKITPIRNIVVVTGPQEENNLLINELERIGTKYFCGSENNLLDRFYHASKKYDTDKIIRVTADNPLIDFSLVNQALEIFNNSEIEIITNSRFKTFPLGQNFDIFTMNALEETWKYYDKSYQDKEKFLHTFIPVTEYMYKNPKFNIYDFKSEKDYSKFRFSMDYEEDYKLMIEIYDRIYYKDKYFTLKDLVNIFELEPELMKINQNRSNN
jgi:spore coat polysaccharide biosynthesis protein SpsF